MKIKSEIEICLLAICALVLVLTASCTESGDESEDDETAFTDIDGNVYHSVIIGNQIWMVENLKTTKLNDGTQLPEVTDAYSWVNTAPAAYCSYLNSDSLKNIYGRLYNWYAVNTGKLCPTGWHVPIYSEWEVLIAYAGGEASAGIKLKEAGTTHWKEPNTGTNESGFTALPSGIRLRDGVFAWFETTGLWWTANGGFMDAATSYDMAYNRNWVHSMAYLYHCGLAVRCVKD